MRKAIWTMVCLTALLLARPGWAATSFTACAEPNGGPPWLYPLKDADGRRTGELGGFTHDMIKAAFAKFGVTLTLRGDLPLTRCMELVANGDIDFALSVYHDAERAQRFAYSAPYKTLTPQIFYSASHPIVVHSVQDLKRYHGCGMHGWSYAHYGLKPGDLDEGGHSYRAMIMKLEAGRCDYFPEELETMRTVLIGEGSFMNDPQLRHLPVSGASAPGKYIVAARNSAAARALPRFNAAVAAMIRSGEFKALWKKNAGELPY